MYDRINGKTSQEEVLRRILAGSTRQTMAPVTGNTVPNVTATKARETCTVPGCALAMVYSPEQAWRELLDPERALHEGTLFKELVKPFEGKTLYRR